MRILIFGAGPLGSLFAAKLKQGGHDVALLARGKREEDLRQYGVVLKGWATGEVTTTQLKIVSQLRPNDDYDIVFVLMRKNQAIEILPSLAANKKIRSIVLLMNNAAGPQVFFDALGAERVLLGFPGAAGYFEDNTVVYVTATYERPTNVIIGDVECSMKDNLQQVIHVLEKAPYFKVTIEKQMDSWLKYHVALLFPTLAPALYLCNTNNYRMAKTPDAIILAIRGIRESFHVLRKLHFPMRPAYLRILTIIPEPLLVYLMEKLLDNPKMEVAMVKHAKAAESEVLHLMDEFMVLVRQSALFTPTIQFLTAQYKKRALPLPEGSASLKPKWSEVFILFLVIILFVLILITIF